MLKIAAEYTLRAHISTHLFTYLPIYLSIYLFMSPFRFRMIRDCLEKL